MIAKVKAVAASEALKGKGKDKCKSKRRANERKKRCLPDTAGCAAIIKAIFPNTVYIRKMVKTEKIVKLKKQANLI